MRYATATNAYLGTLERVYRNYEHRSSPRGQPTRELFNYAFDVIAPKSLPLRTYDDARNQVIADYTRKEFELYDSQKRDAATWGKIAHFWNGIANPDGTVNSAYGWLIAGNRSCGNPPMNGQPMMTPWQWVTRSLELDMDTRQAILRFSLPEHQWIGNKDQVCTMHIAFRIVDDYLRASVVMRSNDVVRGLVYDMPYFIRLQEHLREELALVAYPTLKMGRYSHFAHSMHMYDHDESLVRKMLGLPPQGEQDDGANDRRGDDGDDQEPERTASLPTVGPDDGGDRPRHRDDVGGAPGGG